MRFSIILALLATLPAFAAEVPTKPLDLFNGRDLTGWEYVAPGSESLTTICHVKPDGVLAIDGKPNGYIATTRDYENYLLHVEWRWSDKPGNAGVLVHITEGPMDRIWPISFQVQTKNTRVGDIMPMSLAKYAEPPTPGMNPAQRARIGADVEKPVGEWNSCDIVCHGDTIDVTINGVAQNKVTQCIPAAGKIGFQLEGVPYEIRHVRIEPLKTTIGASYQSMPVNSR